MQTKLLPVFLAAALMTCGLRAEDTTTASTTTPPPAPPTSAPAAAPVVVQNAPAPNQIIYSPRLPTAAELTNVAAAQGLAVQQISETSTQVTAIYKNNATGQITTIAYQLLPNGTPAATSTVVVPTAAPVIYQPATRVIYYDTYDRGYDPYWPSYYYPPVSLSFGFGYYHGWGGGRGWGGGHYHHWR